MESSQPTQKPEDWSDIFAKYPADHYPCAIVYFDSHTKEILHRKILDGPAYVQAPRIRTMNHTFITCRVVFPNNTYIDLSTAG